MNEKDYLDVVRKTWQVDTDDEVLYAMVGLGGEVGEIVNLAAKALRGDFTPSGASRRDTILDEMGGVLWFFTALCWHLGTTPGEIRARNAATVLGRLERGTIRGSGDDR